MQWASILWCSKLFTSLCFAGSGLSMQHLFGTVSDSSLECLSRKGCSAENLPAPVGMTADSLAYSNLQEASHACTVRVK